MILLVGNETCSVGFRVSSSDRREDMIDDLVQEMEASGFWLLNTRQIVANIFFEKH
ncbi:hypothetical protein Syun_018565 [Stephania yunnanensis]|uniref:Uncharacterized protein n=1 Tax=Stephania yunnanensis TaxID=152371 RepID=A0AAP0IU02_9MAGN